MCGSDSMEGLSSIFQSLLRISQRIYCPDTFGAFQSAWVTPTLQGGEHLWKLI